MMMMMRKKKRRKDLLRETDERTDGEPEAIHLVRAAAAAAAAAKLQLEPNAATYWSFSIFCWLQYPRFGCNNQPDEGTNERTNLRT